MFLNNKKKNGSAVLLEGAQRGHGSRFFAITQHINGIHVRFRRGSLRNGYYIALPLVPARGARVHIYTQNLSYLLTITLSVNSIVEVV